MDAIDCIMTRRSIRKYDKKEVSKDIINKILAAAMMAPSAHDQRPWRFLVITDKKLLEKAANVYKYHGMVKDAAFAILACGDPSVEKQEGFWIQDCSAATQNLLLASHSLGLGSVWTGVFPRTDRVDAFRKLFSIPQPIIPFALIPFGYPAETRQKEDRYDETKVHWNTW